MLGVIVMLPCVFVFTVHDLLAMKPAEQKKDLLALTFPPPKIWRTVGTVGKIKMRPFARQ